MSYSRGDIADFTVGSSLLCLFFFWGTAGRFWRPLTIHFPWLHLAMLFAAAIILVPAVRRTAARRWEQAVPRRYFLFPLLAFCVTISIHLFIFQGLPHIQDSIHFRILADQLLAGRLDLPMHPYYEFFQFIYLVPDGEKSYSLFLHGYPLFLAPFVFLGIPFLVSPLLTALNVFLTGRIADDLFGPRVAATAMAIAAGSPFILLMGGTAMAHPFCAALTLLAVLLFLRARAAGTGRQALRYAAGAGTALGWLLITRPQNALFLALPLALAALWELRRPGTVARGLALSAALLPWLIFILAYNHHYTGELFTLRQTAYFNYSEPVENCFGLGLGRGCPNASWRELPPDGFTARQALAVTYHRLSSLLQNLFPHPLWFLLPVLAFFFGAGAIRRRSFLAALFLATVGGHFFYYFDGNVFGPRYYYETAFFLTILAATGLHATLGRIDATRHAQIPRTLLSGFLAASAVHLLVVVQPPLLAGYAGGYWGVTRTLSEEIARQGIDNAVVFIDHEDFIASGFAVMRHDDREQNPVIYVHDRGDRANSALMHHYAGRSFYRAHVALPFVKGSTPVVTPLAGPILPPDHIVVEMEDKQYPLRGVPDYCNDYPGRPALLRYSSLPPPGALNIDFSKRAFFCRFRAPDEYYSFGQNIIVAGRYSLSFTGVAGPAMGPFRVLVDDRPVGTIDFTGDSYAPVTRSVEADLTAGFRVITLEPVDRGRETYFLLDLVEFVRKER